MRTINLLALVGVIYFAGTWGLQWFRAPWSFESLGPTLTGAWEGPLRANLGAEYRVYLDMSYRDIRGRNYMRDNLTGRGRICNRHGEVFEYELDGWASRSGDQVEIQLSFVDPVRSALGNRLEGSWDGQTLTLRPLTNPFMPDGAFQLSRTTSTADPDDSFGPGSLRKSDAASFLVACGRLAG